MKRFATIILVILVLGSAAGAVTMSSDLVGGSPALPKTGTTTNVFAEATFDGATATWIYAYVVQTINASVSVTGFTMANVQRHEFTGAWNDKNFTNPIWSPAGDSVYWQNGVVSPTQGPITFGYRSEFGPDVVTASLIGGTRVAKGSTLGMVPEPGSVWALGVLILGGLGAARRRRV